MKEEKIRFSILWKILISLLPILFGMPILAMVLLSYNIVMSYLFIGHINSLVAALSGICISMFFCGSYGEGAKLSGLFLGIEAILCAASCIFCIVKKKSFYKGVFFSSLMFLIISFIELKNTAAKIGMSAARYLTTAPLELMKERVDSLANGTVAVSSETIEKLFSAIEKITIMILPSVLVISSLIVGYSIMWLVASQIRKIPGAMKHSFSELRLPKLSVALMALSLAIFVINPTSKISYVFLNILIVLFFVAVFTGISIADFYLRRAVKNTFLKIVIHVSLIAMTAVFAGISPYVNLYVIYVLVAMVDSFVSLRKRAVSTEEGGEANEAEERQA